ncbi:MULTISPECIES: phage tail tape measure protein [Mycobacteriaceae]|uniref:phage tail tape measure protein n=1 Tax=Mycobacteriaceae TaxID=1762 RepID=UPI000993AC2C|nr:MULTISPECIES: phage tail tape measure protein [Mycobacteriaceae]MDO3058474.1 phage tail tape measure protein [Mycobacteroides abscessus subsp. abscessus]MDO3277990.1 phage tail tape measure protein [Mycobacteroides abscessus subsp. abscessus]
MTDKGTNIGYAMLPVALSFENITGEIAGKLGVPLKAAGMKAGADAGAAIAAGVDQAKGKVEAASTKVATALKKVEDQAGKTRVAEAQHQALLAKGITDAGKLAAAEEKVAAARRNETAATNAHTNATGALKNAQDGLTRAEKAAGDAAQQAANKQGLIQRAAGQTGKALDGLIGKTRGFGQALVTGLGFGAGLNITGITSSLVAMGDTFANVNKTLAFSTGATGQQLEELNKSVRNIGKDSPKSLTDIADAMASVARSTQLTGKPLEDITKRIIKLNTVGQPADIQSLTQAMRAFGVPADQMAAQMDNLFKVSRATGLGMDQLADTAFKGAVQFKGFGFDLGETAALLGTMQKAGINSEKITVGLTSAMKNLAKGGGDIKEKFSGAVSEIQAMIKAGNESGAITLATKVFGGKAYGPFLDAIKAGKLNLNELNTSLGDQQKGILDAGGAVVGMAGAWQMFKNNVMILLEPIVTRVFGVMQTGILWFRGEGVKHIREFGGVLKSIWSSQGVQDFVGKVVSLFDEWWPKITATAKGVGTAIMDIGKIAGPILVAALGTLVSSIQNVISVGAGIINFFRENKEIAAALGVVLAITVGPALVSAAAGFAVATVRMVAFNLATNAIKIATTAWAAAQWLLNAALTANPIGLIVAGVAALAAGLIYAYKHSETFRRIVDAAWKGIKVAAEAVVNWFVNTAWPFLQQVWEGIKAGWTGLVDTADAVWTGIRDKFNAVVDFFSSLPSAIKEKALGMWDGITGAFKAMVNGLIGMWNGMAAKLTFTIPDIPGVPRRGETIQPIPSLPMLAGGGVAGRTPAGRLWGPGTGTSDSIIGVDPRGYPTALVSTDEGVVKAAAMRGNGAAVVAALNAGWTPSAQYLRAMLTEGGLPRYANGLNPGAEYVKGLIEKSWPQITNIGGYRPPDGYNEHSSGNALDVMIPDWNTPEGKALGDQVAGWVAANANTFGLTHFIWRQRIYKAGDTTGQQMEDRGSPTQNHMDHVHAWFQKGGGALPTGNIVAGQSLTGGSTSFGGATAPLSAGGGMPSGATAGTGPNGESGYYTVDTKKLRDAEQKVSDADEKVKIAEQKLSELKADAKESQRTAAQNSLDKAKREAQDARTDLEDTKKGKFTESKQPKGSGGAGGGAGGGGDLSGAGGIFGSFLKETFGLDGSWLPDISNFGPLKMMDSFMTAFKGPIQGAIDGQLGIQQPGWTPGSDWQPASAAPVSAGGTAAPGKGDAPGTEGGLNIAGLNLPGFQGPPVDASISVTANGPGADEIATAVRRAAPDQQTRLNAAVPTGF